jgi:PIN domain nuclease of toxin-antitoxin system
MLMMALGHLPKLHKDLFGRILVAQAIVESMPLVTKDSQLRQYGVRVIW